MSVSLNSVLWKNGGSDPDAVWHGRSDGSRDEVSSDWDFLLLEIPISRRKKVAAWRILGTVGALGRQGV